VFCFDGLDYGNTRRNSQAVAQDIFILPQNRKIQIGWNPRARAAQAQNMQDMNSLAYE
jgi:hypothetical protein